MYIGKVIKPFLCRGQSGAKLKGHKPTVKLPAVLI